MKSITSKAEFYDLSSRLLLGNRLRQWSWEEFVELFLNAPDHVPKLISVRSKDRAASNDIQRYRLTYKELRAHMDVLSRKGYTGTEFFLDESAPDDLILIQGEVMNTEKFVYLRYNTTPGMGMRQAYPMMKHISGIQAVTLLRKYLDASSWDCMCEILQEYRDSIIEFSSYQVRLGVLGWNTLFWETRNY